MLNRFIFIKNIGRFKNCSAIGDVSLRRYTLVFAENGRGKTTLCAILRSLLTNNPALIKGRRTLGSVENPEVQILAGTENLFFRAGAWSQEFGNLAIFDNTYVSENVFAGDVIHADHRRNLYRVIVGAQGVDLAKRVNELDEQIRDKNAEIREVRARIQANIPPGVDIEAFLALTEDAGIDEKIAAQELELQGVRRAAQLQQRAGLAPVAVPVFPPGFAQLLAKTFQNVAAGAEQLIGKHIAAHNMTQRGEPWINEGLRYVKQDECPFCGQSIEGVELIQAYIGYFGRQYQALRDEVSRLAEQIGGVIGDRTSAAINQRIVQNDGALEFWRQYCDINAPEAPAADAVVAVLGELRQRAEALLQIKAGTPLDAVAPGEEYTRALDAFETLRTSLNAYNASVAAANAEIAVRKRQVQSANVRALENGLSRFKAQKVRHTETLHALCTSEAQLQTDKMTLEQAKETAKQQLDAHTAQIIRQYGEAINRYLERINASFRITNPTHTYRGGPPSTSYQIVINQNAVDLGDDATPADIPSFKNTLSAGDRSTLALAFFFAQLEQDSSRADKTVIFDDPFGSMDSFRRNHTIQQIFKCGESSAQVVVLSHEASFLKLLWDRIPAADRKCLQLVRIGEENTTIAEWDIEKAVQARYLAHIETLRMYHSSGTGQRMDVIQKIRPVLEGYSRNLYPTQFGEQDMLGGIVTKIRESGAAHPLHAIVEDLDEINVYCRRYHHADNPNAATEPIDDAELQGYVKRTLKLVGCLL